MCTFKQLLALAAILSLLSCKREMYYQITPDNNINNSDVQKIKPVYGFAQKYRLLGWGATSDLYEEAYQRLIQYYPLDTMQTIVVRGISREMMYSIFFYRERMKINADVVRSPVALKYKEELLQEDEPVFFPYRQMFSEHNDNRNNIPYYTTVYFQTGGGFRFVKGIVLDKRRYNCFIAYKDTKEQSRYKIIRKSIASIYVKDTAHLSSASKRWVRKLHKPIMSAMQKPIIKSSHQVEVLGINHRYVLVRKRYAGGGVIDEKMPVRLFGRMYGTE